MKLLFYVPVFGKFFAVLHADMEDAICGSFDGEKILINKQIKKGTSLFRETLIHEMIHALFYRGGLSQAPGITLCLEEIVAEQTAKLINEAFTFYLKPEYKKRAMEEIEAEMENNT